MAHSNVRLVRRCSSFVLTAIFLFAATLAAEASTALSIVISGEPWKDPSLAAVGSSLEVSTPPGGGQIWLGWSTTATGAMGVNWQISKAGTPLQSGKAPLPHAALPGMQNWIFIPTTFLAPQPPAAPVNYRVTVRPYDANGNPLGAASPAVRVTQKVDKTPALKFGRATVFPELELVSYLPQIGGVQGTQLRYAIGTVKVVAHNRGSGRTDAMMVYAKDVNGLMRQDSPVPIPSLGPHASREVTLNLKAVLPPAESQLPEDKQYSQWSKDYAEKCGVELRAAMDVDMSATEANSLMDSHRETSLYKGIGSSMSISPVKPEVPLCDSKQCVLMSDVANSIRSQLDGKVVGYAFFLAGCSSMQSEGHGSAQTSADSATGFTPTTKMQVASVSKVITALAAISLIAEKQRTDPSLKQGLDSPIGPYLPTWNWGNEDAVASISFRRLLSQTSGVRNYGNFSMDYSTLKKFFSKPVIAGNDRCAPLEDSTSVDAVNPGIVTDKTTDCYSNFNFALLRVLLPRINGYGGDDEDAYATQYVQIVQDKVFRPLGINDADCRPPDKGSYALAYTFPGSSSGKDFGDQRNECGSKGWYLSVEDLGNVLLSLNGADGRILTASQFRDMELNPKIHAVGWDLTTMGSSRWVEKNGKLESGDDPKPQVTTSIGIFGSTNDQVDPPDRHHLPTPYVPGAVGVLFINSDIAGAPKSMASDVLARAFQNSAKARP